ncbi:complement regulator-acquiring protein [Borrelia persica]|uniref:complement regulator-acquiring protein n=1 Tax=Borrelia persica TaxID=44448 RepID=UPI0004668834|nr:complement regulator-acquiring protein [Borrelia persica]
MRKKSLNNIFNLIAFSIAFTLVGCKPSDLEQTFNFGKKGKQDTANSKQQGLQTDQKKEHGNLIEQQQEDDGEKRKLIEFIKTKVKNEIDLLNQYDTKTEDSEQYGMKSGVFKFIIYRDEKNQEINIQSPQYAYKRKKLYASLKWQEDKIRKLGTILNKIEKNEQAGTTKLAKTILETGIEFIQGKFEDLITNINDTINNLDSLNLEELQQIKESLNTIDDLRKKWTDTIDKIISEYDSNTNNIQQNGTTLKDHVNSLYKTIFQDELRNIKDSVQNIQTILKLNFINN